jgi:uncharacterized OB-fold protein
MKEILTGFPGTPLSEQNFVDNNILYSFDKLDGIFQWDTGIAIGQYLAGLKEGRLIGSFCPKCRKTVIPPRTVCEWCFSPMSRFIDLKDTGTIITYSICYVTWDVKRIQEPEIPAVIEIDGASPLHGILHKLGEVKLDKIHVGMRVKAVWEPEPKRNGAITDICYFRPISEEEK